MGDNGVGKSTFLKTITGNLTSLNGEIIINSKNIRQYTAQQIAQLLSIVITEKLADLI